MLLAPSIKQLYTITSLSTPTKHMSGEGGGVLDTKETSFKLIIKIDINKNSSSKYQVKLVRNELHDDRII